MNDKERLKLVERLVSGDIGEDAEWTLFKKRDFTQEQAREMAEIIGKVYTLVHPVCGCGNPHEDWEKENEKLIL